MENIIALLTNSQYSTKLVTREGETDCTTIFMTTSRALHTTTKKVETSGLVFREPLY